MGLSSDPNPDSDILQAEQIDREMQEIGEALQTTERSLLDLKSRYEQVLALQQKQAVLKHRIEEINIAQRHQKIKQLNTELKDLQAELESIELNLESHLFSWGSLQEPFWQAIRFGGLGLMIGWLLKSIVN
jgi:chromosome segregation ATPase